MIKLFITSCCFWLFITETTTAPPQASVISIETDLFEEAVVLIKKYEGWHAAHYPYIGYGHRITTGENFKADISEETADSLLRSDLKKKCAVFRSFGKDSLILGVLSYNVGEYNLLGHGKKPKSALIRKLETRDRNIEYEYMSFRKAKGKILHSLERRRRAEYNLLFDKTGTIYNLKLRTMTKEGNVAIIKPSETLSMMRLDYLVGKEATIIQDLTSIKRLNKGYMVELTEPYMEETEWFIPVGSIEEDE